MSKMVHIEYHKQVVAGKDGCISRLRAIVNSMGGSPPPGTVQFSDICEGQQERIAELEAERDALNLKARMVTHCDDCGSDWVDNGINSGCSCKRIAELREAARAVLEPFRQMLDEGDGRDRDGHPVEAITASALIGWSRLKKLHGLAGGKS